MTPTDRRAETGADAFWRFWALREEARLLKAEGLPSSDPVIARWRFCCVYRDLDRGTQWFAARRGRGLEQVLWRSLTYRTVNRLETFEAAEGGDAWWLAPETSERWLMWLGGRAARGFRVFGGRHCTRGLPRLLVTIPEARRRLQELVTRLRDARGLRSVCAVLKELPHVGDFYSWQVARDLVEAGELPEDDGWALAGAGARRGATIVVGESRVLSAADGLGVMLRLVRDQDKTTVGLDRSRWHRVPATLADVEHGLCEFSRYEALRTTGPGRVRCEAYQSSNDIGAVDSSRRRR